MIHATTTEFADMMALLTSRCIEIRPMHNKTAAWCGWAVMCDCHDHSLTFRPTVASFEVAKLRTLEKACSKLDFKDGAKVSLLTFEYDHPYHYLSKDSPFNFAGRMGTWKDQAQRVQMGVSYSSVS